MLSAQRCTNADQHQGRKSTERHNENSPTGCACLLKKSASRTSGVAPVLGGVGRSCSWVPNIIRIRTCLPLIRHRTAQAAWLFQVGLGLPGSLNPKRQTESLLPQQCMTATTKTYARSRRLGTLGLGMWQYFSTLGLPARIVSSLVYGFVCLLFVFACVRLCVYVGR